MINLDDLLDSMADDDDNTEDEHFADDGKSQSVENVDLPQDEEIHDDMLPDADEEAAASDSVRMDPIHEAAEPEAVQAEL